MKRTVTVSNREATNAALSVTDGAHWVNVTGKDFSTGELVTFRLGKTAFFDFYDGAKRRASTDVYVTRDRIVGIVSDPEWDSPGTSPED